MNEYNEWRLKQGLTPIEEAPEVPEGTRTPKKQRGYLLTDEAHEGLKLIAYEQGYKNPTQLIEALGTRKWPS